jgi:micrococcal nuclease
MKNSSIKYLAISGIFVVASIIFLAIPERKPESDLSGTNAAKAEDIFISEIIDGDTFELSDGTVIRLIGVDTPEKNEPFYTDAVDFAESHFLGRRAGLEADKDTVDKYGRSLFYVYVDSALANLLVLREGLGLVYMFQSNLRHASDLIEAQKAARLARSGIWSLPEPPAEDYYIRLEGSFRFHRPLCLSIKNSDPERQVKYNSRDSLLDKGFSPCRSCNP